MKYHPLLIPLQKSKEIALRYEPKADAMLIVYDTKIKGIIPMPLRLNKPATSKEDKIELEKYFFDIKNHPILGVNKFSILISVYWLNEPIENQLDKYIDNYKSLKKDYLLKS